MTASIATHQAPTEPSAEPSPVASSPRCADLLGRLDKAFGQRFAVVDTGANVLERVSSDWPRIDISRWLPLCEHVARRGRPEVIEDYAPLTLLAIPLNTNPLGPSCVAVTVLLTDDIPHTKAAESTAGVFGVDAQKLADWARGKEVWRAETALILAGALVEADNATRHALATKSHLSEVTSQLIATFEELNLLHRLSERLSLSQDEQEICEQSIGWLADVIPAECVFSVMSPEESAGGVGITEGQLIITGSLPLETGELTRFFDRLGDAARNRSLVLNRDRTSSPTWCYPEVREIVSAPILCGDRLIGWLAALNYQPKRGALSESFGSVEASLLWSVASMLGVHASNRRLYEDRSKLFNSTLGAMGEVIDAKDPYTCGHSDRVARIAVRLAQQLGLTEADINTIYLGGLLHDIGKIGIDDHVLRKPDKLTDEEFDHIKTHPEMGERILKDVPQLISVLPIVRNHHESWDGSGYPDGLIGEECPLLARIAAVADSFDAMRSDRPYRKGLPIEKIEAILQEGAGKEWDPQVIDAYFAAREDILEICRVERENLDTRRAIWDAAATLG